MSQVTNGSTDEVFNRMELLEQLGGDQDLVREVVLLFLEECPTQLTAIKSAIDRGDAHELYVVAHTLKSTAGTMACPVVAEAARTLEAIGREGRMSAAADPWHILNVEANRLLVALRAMDCEDSQGIVCAH